MNAPLLQLSSITKTFGAVRALNGVSFDLHAGEVHALLGENGAGKSTLIKVITGAHEPDGGTLAVAGQIVKHLTPAAAHRLGIACIYQQPALFPDLTVAENIALRLEPVRGMRRVRWPERRAQAAQLLRRIKAAIPVEAEIRTLSMPEQQLVEIACALGAEARIVIMDEPTASLTRQEQQLLFDVVRELRATGVGVIYISHRLEEIFALADRVTVLRDGESVGTLPCGRRSAEEGPLPEPDRGPSPARSGWTRAVTQEGPGAPDPADALRVRDHPRSERGGFLIPAPKPLTEHDLIRMMVGRELTQVHPPADTQSGLGDVLLSLRNLGCQASGVHQVNLEVRAGEVVGLAGLVGAGRTELARVLFGLTPADAGEIWLGGRLVRIRSPQDALRHGIAYVPEDRRRHGIILEFPVAHNMTLAIHRQIFPAMWLRFGAERSLARDFIRDLGVKASGPDAPASTLSGGNQQKVSLARWLASRPRLLILDEPTQGVDVGAKGEIHKIVRRLAGEGIGVVLISSDLPEVLGMSDRIGVMRGGTITTMLPGGTDAHGVMAAALGQTTHGVGR